MAAMAEQMASGQIAASCQRSHQNHAVHRTCTSKTLGEGNPRTSRITDKMVETGQSRLNGKFRERQSQTQFVPIGEDKGEIRPHI
jgi:hypothetical protein